MGYGIRAVGRADGTEDQNRGFCALRGKFRLLLVVIGMLREIIQLLVD